MRRPLVLALALAASAATALASFGCAERANYRPDSAEPLRPVAALEIDRYLGRWFEVARFPNRFEKNCVGVTADYAQRPDGMVSVVNTCRKGALDAPANTAEGKARVVEPGGARLEVTFSPVLTAFSFVWGDYWVLYIDPNYQLAVVGDPSGGFGWILSRTPQITPEQREAALGAFRSQGYDVSQLEFPAQFAAADDAGADESPDESR